MNDLFMHRCIEMAGNGLGAVSPNPMVGAVLVYDGLIIGEGYHQVFGSAHAEVIAIKNAIEKQGEEILKKAILYVSLEPCVHSGKTPPCCDLILKYKIPEVIIGCSDPFESVNRKGIERLKSNGVKVTVNVLESECRELNKRFLTFHAKKRPYVILKFAQSMDGFIAPENQTEENRWLSNEYSLKLVHKWRSEEDAVLVGATTARIDNPRLSVRHWKGEHPVRIVLDRDLTLPRHLNIFDGSVLTYVFNELNSGVIGDNIELVSVDFGKNIWSDLFACLHEKHIQSLIIEGGAKTLQSVIDSKLWDEARVFTSDKLLGSGIPSPKFYGKTVEKQDILDNRLAILRNATV
jgi:diaminohydroxyphosphoribosylaminopyrimidine deaminase/5-amino-6-(5-phosphoribosylamino)uracil reductase